MKMGLVTVSLPEQLMEFVRHNAEREHRSVSEFFRELVRERMQAAIAADVKFLEASAREALPGPSKANIKGVLSLQRKLREERQKRRCRNAG